MERWSVVKQAISYGRYVTDQVATLSAWCRSFPFCRAFNILYSLGLLAERVEKADLHPANIASGVWCNSGPLRAFLFIDQRFIEAIFVWPT